MSQRKKFILPYRNYVAFVVGIFSFIFYLYIYSFVLSNSSSSIKHINSDLNLVFMLVILTCALWASQIAKENNHGALYWLFISLLIGPFGLILISIKDRNIGDPKILSIILKKREEFKIKLKSMPNSKEQLLEEYENALEDEIAKIPFAFLNNYVKERPIFEYNSEWLEDESKCPACGFKVDENTKYCSSCGLRLR